MSGNERPAAVTASVPGAPVRHLVTFHIEGGRYAVDLKSVLRVLPLVEPTPIPEAPPIVLGAVNLHGEVVPLLDLRRRLKLPPVAPRLDAHLLIARTRSRLIGLLVDEVQGVLEVAADSVRPPDSVVPGIDRVAGIVVLPDGLVLIHDLDAFLSLDEERQLDQALAGGEA